MPQRNGKLFAVHTDHLGTPRLITNENNKPVWQRPYSAFGTTKPTGVLMATPRPNAPTRPFLEATTPAQEFNVRESHQYHDKETGFRYNLLRSLMRDGNRYTQADPNGLDGGMNMFVYVDGDPINWTDSLGLAKSGVPAKVGNSTVRIDKPHVPGQQTHAHVDPIKGGKGTAVNMDGTGSHGATPEDVQNIPNKAKEFLRSKGFNLCPPVLLICPLCNILLPKSQDPS